MLLVKIRHLAITVCVLIVFYWGIVLLTDLQYVDQVASSVQRTVATAAEMALKQVVASDEMFNNGASGVLYNEDGITTVYIANGDTKVYTKQNLFKTVYGTDDKEALYTCMYGANSLFNAPEYIEQVKQVTQEIGAYNIPVFLRMGLLDPNYPNLIPNAKTAVNEILNTTGYTTSIGRFGSDWLGTKSIKKTYKDSKNNSYAYYLAPTNVGITYVDTNLLETAFVSNMDVLMRSQYALNGDLTQGNGLPTPFASGTDYVLTDDVNNVIQQQNIINNGMFGFVKGTCVAGNATGGGYTGGCTNSNINRYIRPVVEYKVVDMCDETNAQLIRLAVTDRVGTSTSATYTEWLEELGIDTSKPYYCVVARVTFYADIVVPYRSDFVRRLYSLYARENVAKDSDFFNVSIDDTLSPTNNAACVSGLTGNPLYAYTTYYAVVP